MNLFELFFKIAVDDQASDQVSKLSAKLGNDLRKSVNQADEQVSKFSDTLDNDLKKSADQADDQVTELSDKLGKDLKRSADQADNQVSKLSNKLGKGLKKAAKIGVAAVSGAATAIGILTKKSLDNYAEYEQLVGGVETLFGAGGKSLEEYAAEEGKTVDQIRGAYDNLLAAEKTVLANADKAYESAGLSANEYMSTVTSFSASLLQNLNGDTQAAADLADQAIVDMSDNVSKLGTDMEMIQNAYQNFAKGQFMLLDNLRLGYGGSQTEMKRLIRDAAKLDDSVDASSMSFDNILRAIHAVQTEMGITGTTAKEASTTIEGSAKAARAAWNNLTVAMASGSDDLEAKLDAFVNSAETYAENMLPRISVIIRSGAKVLKKLAPEISKMLPEITREILPDLADAAVELLIGLGGAIIDNVDILIETAEEAVDRIGEALAEKLPGFGWLFEDLSDKVWMVVNALIAFKTIKGIAEFTSLTSKAMAGLTAATQAQTVAQTALNTATMGYVGLIVAGVVALGTATYQAIVRSIEGTKQTLEEREKNGESKFVGWEDYGKDSEDIYFGRNAKNFISGSVVGNETEEEVAEKLEEILKKKNYEKGGMLVDGSHRLGLARVPYDGYIAELHEGERVLTRREAQRRDKIKTSTSINITINGAKYNDEQSLAEAVAERLQRMLEREEAVYA